MAVARKTFAELMKLKHLDRATLVEIIITPAALAGFADRSHVEDGKVTRGWGYRFVTSWHVQAALKRAIQRKN